MNESSELGFTLEEAVAMDAEMERMLVAIRKANEQIARDQAETEAMQAETRELLARLKERPYVELSF
ncbi:MAG: hypothetical protein HYR56_31660 [Acidobacteria bacterium]|nr:hypothetical protein [Acidobacteriota bacterium]MBI3425930.1 hypothetical protein [Acidobacteriota bacterium]